MEKLTSIIEAILFASGKSVAIVDITDKLNVTAAEVKAAAAELKERYGEDGGLQILIFNNKLQLATNPAYKEEVSAVLNPIREKELTRTILECAAIIAYKQPITKTEIELLRGTGCDYAVRVLLDLQMIYPCGRKDAVGKPILYATTDEFLKRFQLESLDELPDRETLMERFLQTDDRNSYLYARAEYGDISAEEDDPDDDEGTGGEDEVYVPADEKDYSVPEFLRDEEDLVKIE